MEKEKKLFFRRLKDIQNEYGGNIPIYDNDKEEFGNLEDFGNWLLHHSDIPSHKKDGCARRYPIYLKTFIIPLEELDGGEESQSKSRFRKRVATELGKFIRWKYPPPPNAAQEQHQVCTNISCKCH